MFRKGLQQQITWIKLSLYQENHGSDVIKVLKLDGDYISLLKEIKQKVRNARIKVYEK